MAVTSNDIANEAIFLIGDNQPAVSGYAPSFDNSAAGQALQKLYAPCVATVMRQFGYDRARAQAALSLTGNTAPYPFSYEYAYPAGCVQIWQLMPASLPDINNPLPQNWTVGNNIVATVQQPVIWTNLASAMAWFNNNPGENTWDALMREAIVRLLASELCLALEGKPDLSQSFLETGGAFQSLSETRDS